MHDTKVANTLNKTIVSLYKGMGFLILALILGGLFAYLGTHGFFLLNDSWVAPTIISASDDEILTLNARVAAQAAARENLLADRMELRARLEDARRIERAEADYLESFDLAMKGDRGFRARELGKLLALREQNQEALAEFEETSRPWVGMARERAAALDGVQLIDQEGLLTTNHQVAQIGRSGLILAEKEVHLDTRIERLRRDIRSIDALGQGKRGNSVEVLQLQKARTDADLAMQRAHELVAALEANLRTIDDSIARYDGLLASIRSSPWLKAMEGNLTVAFVPYDNFDALETGTPLYSCAIGFIWCSPVGSVARVLDGEVTRKHPIRNILLRGAMVEIELEDPRWAREDLLHLGRAPFFL